MVLKVRNSANPSELQVLQGINKKMFLTPARIGLTSSQLSCEANWPGGGGQVMSVLEFYETVVKVSLSMCSYGGKWGKDAGNQKTLINLGKLEPSVE